MDIQLIQTSVWSQLSLY